MENTDIDKWIKLSIIAGILLITFSVFYYFVIFLPQIQRAKLEEDKRKENVKLEREKERELTELYIKQQETEIRQKCSQWANEQAASLMKTKAEIYPQFKEMAQKGLYLKDDFETSYRDCLRQAGIDK